MCIVCGWVKDCVNRVSVCAVLVGGLGIGLGHSVTQPLVSVSSRVEEDRNPFPLRCPTAQRYEGVWLAGSVYSEGAPISFHTSS